MPSAGKPFHCLQATSHALQPIQRVESVKKPIASRGGGASTSFIPSNSPGLTSFICLLLLLWRLHIDFDKLSAAAVIIEAQQPHVVIASIHCLAIGSEIVRPADSDCPVAFHGVWLVFCLPAAWCIGRLSPISYDGLASLY